MMTVMWVSPRPVLREESSGDEELNAALIPPITFQHEDDFRDHDLDDDGDKMEMEDYNNKYINYIDILDPFECPKSGLALIDYIKQNWSLLL